MPILYVCLHYIICEDPPTVRTSSTLVYCIGLYTKKCYDVRKTLC